MHGITHGTRIHLLSFANKAKIHRFSIKHGLLVKLAGNENILP